MIRLFCWYQNFVPWGPVCLPRGYIHVSNHEKNVWHQTSMRFVWNLEHMNQVAFLVSIDIKILSLVAVCPCPGAIYSIKSWKKIVWNQTSKRFVWNLEQMGKVIKPFCWHQNSIPLGLSAGPQGCIHVLSHEKICIKSDFKDIFLKLATNEWSNKTFLLTMVAVWPCPGAIYYTCINHDKKIV